MRRCLQLLLLWVMLAIAPFAVAEQAPDILLAGLYRGQVDVSGYLVSEKLDGVRGIWDGQVLRFRSGHEIRAPRWFLDGLPKTPLDGELWIARGQFEHVSGIVRTDVPDDRDWRQVRYMVFELPGAPGSFRERAARIREIVRQAKVPWLQAVEQLPAVDRKNVQKRFEEVVRGGGEGLMLHRADALYETGRGDTLLKMKPWDDAEGVVVGHLPGQGKYAGQLGALLLRLSDGREFAVGSGFTDVERQNPPALGSTVTFRYRGLTKKGLPRFASFLRIRKE